VEYSEPVIACDYHVCYCCCPKINLAPPISRRWRHCCIIASPLKSWSY